MMRLGKWGLDTKWYRIRSESYGLGVDVDTWNQLVGLEIANAEVWVCVPGWGRRVVLRIGHEHG